MDSIKLDYDFNEMSELSRLISSLGILSKETMPNTSQSVQSAAKYVQNRWSEYLAGGSLEGIPNVEKPIAPSKVGLKIQTQGPFNADIVTSSKRVVEIQEGADPVYYDMKQTHPYGRRSRVTQSGKNKGVPYLIIPFRWGTPGKNGSKRRWNNTIPQAQYDTFVKTMKMSRTTDQTHIENNARGEPQTRAEYIWKQRITIDNAWDDRSVGLVKMEDAVTGKGTYFTFRVISAKSPAGSWLYWKDGKDPVDMLGALKKDVKDTVEKIIENGIRADLGI